MFNIKIEARKAIRGKTIKLRLMFAFPFILKICASICLISPIASIFSGAGAIYNDISLIEKYPFIAVILLSVQFLCGVFLLIFSYGVKLYAHALLYEFSSRKIYRASSVLDINISLKYIYLSLRIFLYKLLWFLLFFSPAALFIGVFRIFYSEKAFIPEALFILIMLLSAYFITGYIFYFITVKRYSPAVYIMLSGTEMKTEEIIKRSIGTVKGKYNLLAALKFTLLPWKICRLFLPAAPFSFVYIKSIETVFYTELISSEQKCENPVTFYINRFSHFKSVT